MSAAQSAYLPSKTACFSELLSAGFEPSRYNSTSFTKTTPGGTTLVAQVRYSRSVRAWFYRIF